MHLLTHLIEMSLVVLSEWTLGFQGCVVVIVAVAVVVSLRQPRLTLNLLCSPRSTWLALLMLPPISTSHLVYAVLETRARASYGSGSTLAAELCSSPGSSVYVFSVSQQYKHSWENPKDCPNTQLFNLTCLKIKCISKSR